MSVEELGYGNGVKSMCPVVTGASGVLVAAKISDETNKQTNKTTNREIETTHQMGYRAIF